MDAFAILRAFGGLALLVAVAATFTGLVAAAQGDMTLASGFALTVVVCVFFGGSLRIMAAGRSPRAGVREALAFALLAWTLAPALAAPPFVFAGAPSPLHAYVDALSAATTTGAPPFFACAEAIAAAAGDATTRTLVCPDAPPAAILWWNVIQWVGGGATVLTALIVLASVNISGAGLHRSPLFTLEPDRLFDRFAPVGRAVFSVYALATAIAFVVLWATGEGAGDAAAVALAGVSTGGLLLPNGATGLAHEATPFVAASALALMFGAYNFALHWDVARGRSPAVYLSDAESRSLFVFFGFAVLAVAATSGATTMNDIARTGVQGIALASTAGWDVEASALALSSPLMLALVIVGGSPVSTAGGVKLMRIVLLARQAGGELRRLANPSAVHELRFRGKALPARAIMSMLAYVIAYAIALAALVVAFGAAEAPFETALAAAAAALSNAGPVIGLVGGGAGAYAPLDTAPALAIFSVGMILGRLEVFAAWAVIAPTFWRD